MICWQIFYPKKRIRYGQGALAVSYYPLFFILVAVVTFVHLRFVDVCWFCLPGNKSFMRHCQNYSAIRLPLVLAIILLIVLFSCVKVYAQSEPDEKVIDFPLPMKSAKWRSSIGFSFLTTPEDITEEVRLRVPAGEYTVLRKLNERFNLSGKLTFQVLQNHLALGGRWVHKQSDVVYFSVGDELGYWFGFLPVDGFDSKAHGWMNYFNVSVGFRLEKDLWLTLKAETSQNLFFKASNGENVVSNEKNVYNGEAFTISLEQPFFHKKHMTLSLTGYYNYFQWQTWSLFYMVDRKIFYPQIKLGFIL